MPVWGIVCCQNAAGKPIEWLWQLFRHCFYTIQKQLTAMTLPAFYRLTTRVSFTLCVYVCVRKRERKKKERQRMISALLGSVGFNATPKTICTRHEDDKSQKRFEPRTGPGADKSNFLLQTPSTAICAHVHYSTLRKPSIVSVHIIAVFSHEAIWVFFFLFKEICIIHIILAYAIVIKLIKDTF